MEEQPEWVWNNLAMFESSFLDLTHIQRFGWVYLPTEFQSGWERNVGVWAGRWVTGMFFPLQERRFIKVLRRTAIQEVWFDRQASDGEAVLQGKCTPAIAGFKLLNYKLLITNRQKIISWGAPAGLKHHKSDALTRSSCGEGKYANTS